MNALVGDSNQEKALVGAFSMIVQLHRLIVYSTNPHTYLVPVSAVVGVHDGRGGGPDGSVDTLGNDKDLDSH